MISITQMRAARALLNLSQEDVAQTVGIAANTLSKIEQAKTDPHASSIDLIQTFYESRGIEFTSGEGVRKRVAQIIEHKGAEGFRAFMDDVYNNIKEHGGIVCAHDVRPDYWMKWLGNDFFLLHTNRMQKIEKNYKVRITIRHGDSNLLGSKHAEYRWLPEGMWNDQAFYSYADKLALIVFEPDDIHIRVICSQQFAEGFRSLFNLAWDSIPPIPDMEQKR